MPVRVRYKPTDLSEGVVETIPEADDYQLYDTGEVVLFETWVDEGTEKVRRRHVGVLPPGAWDSVVIMADIEGSD